MGCDLFIYLFIQFIYLFLNGGVIDLPSVWAEVPVVHLHGPKIFTFFVYVYSSSIWFSY